MLNILLKIQTKYLTTIRFRNSVKNWFEDSHRKYKQKQTEVEVLIPKTVTIQDRFRCANQFGVFILDCLVFNAANHIYKNLNCQKSGFVLYTSKSWQNFNEGSKH